MDCRDVDVVTRRRLQLAHGTNAGTARHDPKPRQATSRTVKAVDQVNKVVSGKTTSAERACNSGATRDASGSHVSDTARLNRAGAKRQLVVDRVANRVTGLLAKEPDDVNVAVRQELLRHLNEEGVLESLERGLAEARVGFVNGGSLSLKASR